MYIASEVPRRVLPPQSPGLPPSGIEIRVDHPGRVAHRKAHPAKMGKPTKAERELIVQTTMALMDKETPEHIAALVQRDTKAIKDIIKTARQNFQNKAAQYVEAHWEATQVASAMGDAKPAQWALEHLAEGEQRVVEREKAGSSSPSIQIGIALGGVPTPATAVFSAPLPAQPALPEPVEAEVIIPEDLLP